MPGDSDIPLDDEIGPNDSSRTIGLNPATPSSTEFFRYGGKVTLVAVSYVGSVKVDLIRETRILKTIGDTVGIIEGGNVTCRLHDNAVNAQLRYTTFGKPRTQRDGASAA